MELSMNSLIQKLSVNEQSLPTLLEIKAYITSASPSALKNAVDASNLLCLFDCLNTNDSEQIEVCCFILSSMLPIVDPLNVVRDLSHSIHNCLSHSNPLVQHFGLRELERIITTLEGTNALSESPEVIKHAVKLIGDVDMSVASAAVRFISQYGRMSPNVARALLGPSQESNLKDLKSVMSKGDEVRYRVYEVVCNIQSESQEMLDLCVESGILGQLIKELSGNDVLLRVTCCAMLAEIASSQHSLDYLDQSGVVSQMVELLKNAPSEPFSDLYVPGIIKFFGNLCMYSGPERVLDMYPGYCDLLFSMLDDVESSNQQVAIETIGVIGTTLTGKCILAEQGNKSVIAMKRICQILKSGSQDLRLLAVNTMCCLLDHSRISDETLDRILPITLSWFRLISMDPIDTVLSLCKQPFTSIRCSGLHLLKTIASCAWGIEAMVELAMLTEYLLDRTTETEKECKEAKYQVVEALANSRNCASVFGNQNYLKFRQFTKEGPYYVEAQLNVAIEEA